MQSLSVDCSYSGLCCLQSENQAAAAVHCHATRSALLTESLENFGDYVKLYYIIKREKPLFVTLQDALWVRISIMKHLQGKTLKKKPSDLNIMSVMPLLVLPHRHAV